ncbi:MAG: twin-arginine translocase TatA/TatE family subunit, partial [Acidobacteriota bacterium]|nr:twin-arginine translocase TatA/TatE family subunit [Acidobacteriota bacterium]
MFTLSPWKIVVIVVVALLVLGPEKLPSVARQVGGFWGDFRRFRARLEDEVRGVFPDLPPSHEVARAVRSPLAYLNRLADEHEQQSALGAPAAADAGAGGADDAAGAAAAGADGVAASAGQPGRRASGLDGLGDGMAL